MAKKTITLFAGWHSPTTSEKIREEMISRSSLNRLQTIRAHFNYSCRYSTVDVVSSSSILHSIPEGGWESILHASEQVMGCNRNQ